MTLLIVIGVVVLTLVLAAAAVGLIVRAVALRSDASFVAAVVLLIAALISAGLSGVAIFGCANGAC